MELALAISLADARVPSDASVSTRLRSHLMVIAQRRRGGEGGRAALAQSPPSGAYAPAGAPHLGDRVRRRLGTQGG